MKPILKLLISTLLISTFCASTCDDPETKKGGNNNIVVINNSQNNTTNTSNQTTNTTQNNIPENNVKVPEYPFKNDPTAAVEALELVSYKCYADDQDAATRLKFSKNGVLKLDDFKGVETSGTWTLEGEKITVSLPEVAFNETTTLIAIDLDIVATMVFPSTICSAISVNNEAFNEEAILYCASHEWVSMVLIENSEFSFENTGFVRRRHWEELLSIPDTLYSTYNGIWKNVGDVIYVVFPRATGEEGSIRYLTMTPEGERYRVAEFTHPSGSKLCEWR